MLQLALLGLGPVVRGKTQGMQVFKCAKKRNYLGADGLSTNFKIFKAGQRQQIFEAQGRYFVLLQR